jgi:hypothetical protein
MPSRFTEKSFHLSRAGSKHHKTRNEKWRKNITSPPLKIIAIMVEIYQQEIP